MRNSKRITPCLLALGAVYGCGGGGSDGLPTDPPTRVEKVSDEGFKHAGAVAASPDGETFYVAAFDDEDRPGVFSISVSGGAAAPVYVGTPLLYPSDLATSCDGGTIYVSDLGLDTVVPEGEMNLDETDVTGAIYGLSIDGDLAQLQAEAIHRAAGIVVSVDCSTLYISGFTAAGMPAVFTVPVAGGPVDVLYEGAPLMSPTGIHVDVDNVAWVMDHAASGDRGDGMLFAINAKGEISEVLSGLGMGRHGGVSLTPGGTTAVMPTLNEDGESMLVTANTNTGEEAMVPTPEITSPTGTAAATEAPVMVVAGENSIHIATFE